MFCIAYCTFLLVPLIGCVITVAIHVHELLMLVFIVSALTNIDIYFLEQDQIRFVRKVPSQ